MAFPVIEKAPQSAPLNVAVRRDTWWVKPLLTVIGLLTFAIYATWRAFEASNYFYPWSVEHGAHHHASYISPFYSPLIETGWKLGEWTISPAFYILVFPLAFRMTCYYYRQAYYRSFFQDPVACAVPEPGFRKSYSGEQAFPLILQNLHRYALYAALIFLVFLAYDALKAFTFYENGQTKFGVGIGSLIMLANVVLLSGYTFGCHSFRHLVGGKLDCFTCPRGGDHANATIKSGYKAWKIVTMFNLNHMQWAWTSLFGVILTDLYIRSVAIGAIPDVHFVF
jgi:hypothetical protein